ARDDLHGNEYSPIIITRFRLTIERCGPVTTADILRGLPLRLVYADYRFPNSSTCLLPFVSLETRRIPASSSFISSRLSSLKLTSPRSDLSCFSRSMSVIGPFFSRISTMDRDIGRGLHILLNAGSQGEIRPKPNLTI